MSPDLVIPLLVAVMGSGVATALATGLLGRRKLSAEATEIVTRAAGEQIGRLRDEIEGLRTQVRDRDIKVANLERRVDASERREMVHRDLLQVHTGWDWRVLQVLQKHLTPEQLEAEQIRPAPPLYPHS